MTIYPSGSSSPYAGPQQVLQVKGFLQPTDTAFSGRDTINEWSTVYRRDTRLVAGKDISDAFCPAVGVRTDYTSIYGSSITFDGNTFSFSAVQTVGAVSYLQLRIDDPYTGLTTLPSLTIPQPSGDLYILKTDNADPDNDASAGYVAFGFFIKT